jgi:hypothetical protein
MFDYGKWPSMLALKTAKAARLAKRWRTEKRERPFMQQADEAWERVKGYPKGEDSK